MATYTQLFQSFDSVFASSDWSSLNLTVFPSNFYPPSNPKEFLRYEVIPLEESTAEYGESNYKAGLFNVQIYVQANRGPARVFQLAESLDTHFSKKLLGSTQTHRGKLDVVGMDKDDTSLFRADYSLFFNSY